MPYSIYQASIPALAQGLGNLGTLLEKGRADAVAREFDPDVLLTSRLAPDMHSLLRQVQVASDMAKGGVARLAGIDAPSFPDTETTYDQLQERIAKTVAFVKTITEAQLDGSETRTIVMKFPGLEMTFTGAEYLGGFVLPNFYFHLTTAFAILRHNGVKIGKRDFLGA